MSSGDGPDHSITVTLHGREAADYLILRVLQSDDKRLDELKTAISSELKAAVGAIGTLNVDIPRAIAAPIQPAIATINDRLSRIETAVTKLEEYEALGTQSGNSAPNGQPANAKPRSWASSLTFGIL